MKRYTTLAERLSAFANSDVYPVISSEFCAHREELFILEEVLKGGAKTVQIREKHLDDKRLLVLLKKAREITGHYGALLIVNDRVDLALASGADGVHLGQDDMPLEDALKIAPELLIGTSTHNLHELKEAQRNGCGYLNIGPVFPTGTKTLAMNNLGTAELKKLIPEVSVPFSVMGGIKFHHLEELRSLGVKHVAAVTAFTSAADPAAEIRKWKLLLNPQNPDSSAG